MKKQDWTQGFHHTADHKTFDLACWLLFLNGHASTVPPSTHCQWRGSEYVCVFSVVNHLWHSVRFLGYRIHKPSSRVGLPCVWMVGMVPELGILEKEKSHSEHVELWFFIVRYARVSFHVANILAIKCLTILILRNYKESPYIANDRGDCSSLSRSLLGLLKRFQDWLFLAHWSVGNLYTLLQEII